MAGALYLFIALAFGIATGVVGRLKGSSFLIWFVIGAVVPVLGLITAVAHRSESDELRKQCENCGKVVPLYQQICTRCGAELDFPEVAIEPRSAMREA